MMILMTLTSIVSRQQLKIRILIQEISMMEKRIRELEKEAEEGGVKKEQTVAKERKDDGKAE